MLFRSAWPAILGGLKEREESITQSLETAEKIKAEMLQLQNDNEDLFKKTQEERAVILKEARDIKEKIIVEAKEQAKIEIAKIVAEAQLAIENKKMAAITESRTRIPVLYFFENIRGFDDSLFCIELLSYKLNLLVIIATQKINLK